MPSFGQQLIHDYDAARDQLDRLSHEDYQPAQIRDVVTAIGYKTELFLKSVIFPAARSRNTFEWFIDELATLSVSQDCRDKLHVVRQRYNQAKHSPNVSMDLISTLQVVKDGRKAIEELVTNSYGSVNALVPHHQPRIYWIAGWDHYIGGDTEIHILVPGTSEHWLGVPTLDSIYVKMSAVDSIKAELSQLGVFSSGEGIIPQSQFDKFDKDDFLGAWVFEGDYRSLITTLAKFELRQQLLPGLNRKDDDQAMIIAYLFAGLDALATASSPAELERQIDGVATVSYAVPPDYPHAKLLAEDMARMFGQLPASDWHRISGPSWVRKDAFETFRAGSITVHDKHNSVIDKDLVVRCRIM